MKTGPLLALGLLPLLAGCINDGDAYLIDGKDHSLSVVREQRWPWDSKVDFLVVTSRMPDCLRRHLIASMAPKTRLEVWQPGNLTYVLRTEKQMWVTETRTCNGFAPLDEDPPGGLGSEIGYFQEKDGKFRFVAAEKPPAPPAPAEAQAAAEPATAPAPAENNSASR
ncbi:MAG: hypothetical protein RIR00_2212 [Pseudomonadota bacterium]|jgi:hypothetical protein